MWSWLTKIAACLAPVRRHARTRKDEDGSDNGRGGVTDDLLWSRDIGRHAAGEFSFAVAQANETLEDHSQVETGAAATFVGVYDGHGGAEASRFISDHLFAHLIRLAQENGTISEDVVRSAFSATEDGFLTLVRRTRFIKPLIAAVGSCCLVGVIWRGTLYVANLGDSRAVVGSLGRSNKIVAEPLTIDHNASVEEVRQELISRHPDDSQIVVLKHGVWRIKGIIQVSRTIGDAYLKRREFALDPSITRFRLSEPLRRPVLTAEPSICTRALHPQDKFVIFATDGLWEHLTNQQAVEIVYNNPRRPSVSGRDAEEVRGVEPERLKGLAWWGWNGLVGFDLLLVIKTKINLRRNCLTQEGLHSVGPSEWPSYSNRAQSSPWPA
ncbi:hypothetical protein PVAP13_1KG451610 [Panicum virgatum]|uniref:protein-serine/threonine phosphatase n=1 Tax=Panicum virgatum TaxID=38727 RepID=A0A8T0XGW6_PANVG|nr:hypothetical protein PVAP13_1KG451610 [Panicum virgatum]